MIPPLLFFSCILVLLDAFTRSEDLKSKRLGHNERRTLAKEWSILHGAEPGFNLNEEEIQKFKIWPQGIIPYFIDNYSFDEVLSIRLRTILNNINSLTNLRFLELSQPIDDNNERWVLFINRRGVLECEDYNTISFTNKGVQRVVVGYDCVGPGGGAFAPVVLALAGVPPQHNAPDRDNYITVLMENIIPEKRSLFKALKNDEWLFHDVRYDFLSAGHYDFYKYTINGSATIQPKETVMYPVGEGDGISYKDVWKIRMLYNFISRKTPKAKASDCNKLYKPGIYFENLKHENDVQVTEPRQKPAKYLGFPEDEVEQIDNNSENKNALDSTNNKNIIDENSINNEIEYDGTVEKPDHNNEETVTLDISNNNKNVQTAENVTANDRMAHIDKELYTEESLIDINDSKEPNRTLLYGPGNYKFIRAPPKRNPLKKMLQLKNDWRTSDSDGN